MNNDINTYVPIKSVSQYFFYNMVLINSSSPSAAYMHQWTGSALVQVMACRLLSTKPLAEQMLAYCQLDP